MIPKDQDYEMTDTFKLILLSLLCKIMYINNENKNIK